jgi:hypothetical protein
LAEALREPAPQHLRETARAIAALPLPLPLPGPAAGGRRRSGLPRRRVLLLGAAAAISVAVPVAWFTRRSPEPGDPLAAADSAFHYANVPGPGGASPPVARIGEFAWQGSAQLDLAGYRAIGYRYTGPDDQGVLLISCDRKFPRPTHAVDLPDRTGWLVSMPHCTIVCTEHAGASWLTIADTREQALHAANTAGLAT